jgi:hypothetical protein
VTRTECELHVNAAQVPSKVAVLVLGIDDIDLDPATKRPNGDRGQQVGLSGARVAENKVTRVLVSRTRLRSKRSIRAGRVARYASNILNVQGWTWQSTARAAASILSAPDSKPSFVAEVRVRYRETWNALSWLPASRR